jgi:hypothetical protein
VSPVVRSRRLRLPLAMWLFGGTLGGGEGAEEPLRGDLFVIQYCFFVFANVFRTINLALIGEFNSHCWLKHGVKRPTGKRILILEWIEAREGEQGLFCPFFFAPFILLLLRDYSLYWDCCNCRDHVSNDCAMFNA